MKFQEDDPYSTVLAQFEAFGLTTYAARTLATLVRIGEGTAREVSEAGDVPRTRVYDAVEELSELGLAEAMQSSPKRFSVADAETLCRAFEREHADRMGALSRALSEIEPSPVPRRERGVWTVDGTDAVRDRVIRMLEAADEEVLFATDPAVVSEDVVDALSAVGNRGVSVTLADRPASTAETLLERVPGATVAAVPWMTDSSQLTRLLIIDGDRTLVAVDEPHDAAETAVWGSGESNGFVVVLRSLLG